MRRQAQCVVPPGKAEFPLSQVYGLLEPGPVVLLSTAHAGRPNVMPMSWHTMMEFVPPLVGCVVSSANYTFEVLRRTGECVLNLPTVELAKKVVACGNASGRSVDKFKTIGLTPVAGTVVKAPLIAECFASLECRVTDRKLVASFFSVLDAHRPGPCSVFTENLKLETPLSIPFRTPHSALRTQMELERERLAGGRRLPEIFSRPPKAPEAPEPAAPDSHESNPVKPSQTNFFLRPSAGRQPHVEGSGKT